MHNQSHHNYPDNTVLLVLSSLFKTMSLTLTGNELGTSTATISRALSTAREFLPTNFCQKRTAHGTHGPHA